MQQLTNMYPLFTDGQSFIWVKEEGADNELVHHLVLILMDVDLTLAHLPAHNTPDRWTVSGL